jgi:transmembrane sensor
MNGLEEHIISEAALWHSASIHDDMDWDGFTLWLEADPRHRIAYDEVAAVGMLLEDNADGLKAAFPDESDGQEQSADVMRPAYGGWKRWAGGAIAASLVASLAVTQFAQSGPVIYNTEAVSRTVALNDGSQVLLAPHSRLTIDGDKQQRIALAGGAWFDIRHDVNRPMTITAGDIQISDIGTKFDVQTNGSIVRVEVGEGEVQVSASGLSRSVHLNERRGLTFDSNNQKFLVTGVNKENIGEWRSGRLSYEATPLTLVATDLSRYAGVKVKVADSLHNEKFSGTLAVGDKEAALRDLSLLMDIELSRSDGGYILSGHKR